MNPVADNLAAIYPMSWADMASWWKEEEVNFPYLSKVENKILHLHHFEGKDYVEIAQQLVGVRGRRWSKDAIRLLYQRIIKKIKKALSKGGRVVERRKVTPTTQKAPDWVERKKVTGAMLSELMDVRYNKRNRHKPDMHGLPHEGKEKFLEGGGMVQRPDPVLPLAEHGEFTISGWVEWGQTHPSLEVQEDRIRSKPIRSATTMGWAREVELLDAEAEREEEIRELEQAEKDVDEGWDDENWAAYRGQDS